MKKTDQCEDCADREACFGEDGSMIPLGCPNAFKDQDEIARAVDRFAEAYIQMLPNRYAAHDLLERLVAEKYGRGSPAYIHRMNSAWEVVWAHL